jgi:alkylhydroperoxidase family enzyme
MIRMLGIEGPEPEQIAVDYTSTNLPLTVKALLGFATKLTTQPTKISSADVDALRTYGYSDEQIHETVALVGAAKYANFLAFGLGTLPDFDSSRIQLPAKETASAVGPVL